MEPVKKREWVKNAAIIFLSVLLVLTFFSNTIMNRSLPEVATVNVTSGSIVARVRGTGTVTASGSSQVKAEKTRVIRSVLVKAGQKVEVGDVLFTLGEGTSEEIEAAEEKLRSLQNSYRRAAAGSPTYTYTAENERLKQAKAAMDAAKLEMDAAEKAALEASELSNELEDLKNQVDHAKKVLEEATDLVTQKEEELREAEEKEKISDEELTELQEELQSLLDFVPDTPEIQAIRDRITEINRQIAEKQALVDRLDELKEERDSLSDDPSEWLDPDNNEDLNEDLRQVLKDIRDAEKARDEEIPALQRELAEKEAELAEAIADVENPNADRIAELQERISAISTSSEVEKARKALREAEDACEEAADTYELLSTRYDTMLTAGADTPQSALYKEKKAAYDAARLNYLSIKESLEDSKAADARNAAATALELEDLRQQIEAAQKKLAELLGGEDSQITAKVAGVVQSVEATAGDTKQKGDVLCTIEVPDMGYTLSFSVTNDQASRLRPGDTATVSNFYWGTEIVATLNNIKTDPKNPQTNKLLTFDLTGNVTAGSELTISVGQKSANYDVIIPSSSIRSDANGSFVLKIEAKNSPLGNRYVARRVPVEVLASDDTNSAVTADLSYGDYVITTSNVPVKNGELVRLANE